LINKFIAIKNTERGNSSQWCSQIEEEADAGVAVVDAIRPASRMK
jgi:hypothetical protein